MYYLLSSIIFILLILPASGFSATTTYVYDELDRLQDVVLEDGTQISYEYDEIGNIINKKLSGNNVVNITATALNGGNIYPSGVFSINSGGSKTFTIMPLPGYKISNVYVDGTRQGEINSYSFSNIITGHTITASFAGEIPIVKISSATPTYYSSLQEAYNMAADGDTIQCRTADLTENLSFNLNKSVTVIGGYDTQFTASSGVTTIHGAMNVSAGNVTSRSLNLQY